MTNDYPLTGGLDAESDIALRTRFGGFMDSRTRATVQAVEFAIQSVQQGLSYRLVQQLDPSGTFRAGHFTVVVDDGSGVPSDGLLLDVGNAVEAVRAVGSTYSIVRPQILTVNVTLQLSGGTPSVVQAAIGAWDCGATNRDCHFPVEADANRSRQRSFRCQRQWPDDQRCSVRPGCLAVRASDTGRHYGLNWRFA